MPTHILLLEDIPEAAAWLKVQIAEVYPDVTFHEANRVAAALRIIGQVRLDLALIDLGLPDGSGVDAVAALHEAQPNAQAVVVTIHDDDDHLFPALQAGAFGYLLKDQAAPIIVEQFRRMSQGEPPLSPAIARRVMAHFASRSQQRSRSRAEPHVALTDRENEVLLRVAKGFTLPEIAVQLELSRHTISDYVKQIYRKLNVSSRAEAALEAQRLGLFGRGRRSQEQLV
ncbi:MAG: response regulator transcription factor [Pseudomonadota bacterium]|nr:response regulator transcription factor [Pseudomonadota bacterium]